MSDLDLSGEEDPTERMTAQDAQLDEDPPENHRETEFKGEDQTEEFDLDDALEAL